MSASLSFTAQCPNPASIPSHPPTIAELNDLTRKTPEFHDTLDTLEERVKQARQDMAKALADNGKLKTEEQKERRLIELAKTFLAEFPD